MARRDGKSIFSDKNSYNRMAWEDASHETVHRELTAWVQNLEVLAWPRRYRSLLFYRYMTGRPVNPAFHYSLGPRPGSVTALYSRVQWQSPSLNVLAQCDDVLANRVYSQQPFLQWVPDAGNFASRVNSKNLTRWTDAAFYTYKIWDLVEACGSDSRMYGAGWLKVDAGINKDIAVTRILDDEVFEDETELNVTDLPSKRALRIFVSRDEMMARFGDVEGAKEAIKAAPSVNIGLYFGGQLDTSNVITLIEAWKLGIPGRAGRHVMCLPNFTFVDEKYTKDHYPMARLPYKNIPNSRPMGMAEQVLSLQREVERVMAAFQENIMRVGWPRIAVESGSNVNDSSLAGKSGGIFRYTKTPPTFINPQAITKDQFQYLDTLIGMIRQRIGISDQAAVGMQQVLRSGIAIEKTAQLDDVRHKELSKHLEDFVECIGTLLVEAAMKSKPVVTLPGRFRQQIKWSDLDIDNPDDMGRPRAYPLSSLPQTIAGRQEIIDQRFAEGRMSKQTKDRLEQVPDIDGYTDIITASQDSDERALDMIVEQGEYQPPTEFGDVDGRLAYAQSRFLFEQNSGTPQDRLDMIMQYMAALKEIIDERDAPTQQAAMSAQMSTSPGGFGVQPPQGVPGNPQVPTNLPAPAQPLPSGIQ